MEENDAIDLQEIIDILRQRIGIILIITAVCLVTSGVVSFFILEPIYETSTTMIVGKTRSQEQIIEYSDVLLSQKLVKTYGEIAKSRIVSNEVISNLGLELTPEQLKEKVTVTPVGDTEIIMIKVHDNSPVLATDIANNVAQVFMKHVIGIMKVDNVQVIDKAEIPIRPIKPRHLLNISIAGMLGLMLAVGIVFLLEYLDNTIKSSKDVEKYLELPIIGAIPQICEQEERQQNGGAK